MTRRRPKSLQSLLSWWESRPPLRRPAISVPRAPGRRAAPGRWVRDQRSPGVTGRTYDVYLPAGLRRRSRVPMVVLLHGCQQTAAEFVDATRFTTVADRNGFVLVAPQQEGRYHSRRCWRWYEAAHQHRGSGEPATLAAVVRQAAAEENRWRIDPLRIYVAGLSAGGAMALTLAATYPDLIAAAAVHSAPPYRSATLGALALSAMRGRTPLPGPGPADPAIPPLLIIQGTDDDVVRQANGDRVADQWLAFRAAVSAGESDPRRVVRSHTDHGRTDDGRDYTRVRWYTARRARVLEYWLVKGLGHAWSGGRPGGSFSDPAGPRAATLVWAFFRTHRLEPRAVAEPDRAFGA